MKRTNLVFLIFLVISLMDRTGAAQHKRQRSQRACSRSSVPVGLVGGNDNDIVQFGCRRNLDGNRGGGPYAERALALALGWLARHQSDEGCWSPAGFNHECKTGNGSCGGPGIEIYKVGLTGLALLAFLGAGHTQVDGDYSDNVRRAVKYLRKGQTPDGCFCARSGNYMYNHIIATYALTEASGMNEGPLIRSSVQKGLDFLVGAQHIEREGCRLGWHYTKRPGKSDSSVTGWACCTLAIARSLKFNVRLDSLGGGLEWFDKVTDKGTGQVGYTGVDPGPVRAPDRMKDFPAVKSESLTAAALLVRFFCGQAPQDFPVMIGHAERIMEKPPVWNTKDGSIDIYYWYYATHAMYQMGGCYWDEWEKAMRNTIIGSQIQEGCARGSWDPAGCWGPDGGRIYTTAMLSLCLEAYYRYDRINTAASLGPGHTSPEVLFYCKAETDRALRRVRKSLKSKRLEETKDWEYLYFEALNMSKSINSDSPRDEQAEMLAYFQESSIRAAKAGNTNHLAVVDHDLASLGMPHRSRWHLLETARKNARNWKVRTRPLRGPIHSRASLKIGWLSRLDYCLQTAPQAAKAGELDATRKILKDAGYNLMKLPRHLQPLLGPGLYRCIKQCRRILDIGGQELHVRNTEKLFSPEDDFDSLKEGCLLTMAGLDPDEWKKLYRNRSLGRKVKRRNQILTGNNENEIRFVLRDSDRKALRKQNQFVGVVRGWFRPPESGMYLFYWKVDDGGFLLLNHTVLSDLFSGEDYGKWRKVEVYLERRPYLLEVPFWDCGGACNLTINFKKRNKKHEVPVPLILRQLKYGARTKSAE